MYGSYGTRAAELLLSHFSSVMPLTDIQLCLYIWLQWGRGFPRRAGWGLPVVLPAPGTGSEPLCYIVTRYLQQTLRFRRVEAKTWWNCFQDSLEGELGRSQAWLAFKNTQLGIWLLLPVLVGPPRQEFRWRPSCILLNLISDTYFYV